MTTLEVLQRKIKTADELQSIVKTMKALAAVNIHQYESAIASLSQHSRVLEMGIQILMIHHPDVWGNQLPTRPQKLGIVIFGSDQGMCGRFNQQIIDAMVQRLERLHKGNASHGIPLASPTILAVGSRVADGLNAVDQAVEQCLTVPSSIAGITPLVHHIVVQLETWRQTGKVDHIWVFYNRPPEQPTGGIVSLPNLLQLFPISHLYLQHLRQQPWPSRCRPQLGIEGERLFSALFQQHFFLGLYRACAESLASENASRLASMQVAEKNIADRLSDLQTAFQHQRQETITEELLDIVSGFEALTSSY